MVGCFQPVAEKMASELPLTAMEDFVAYPSRRRIALIGLGAVAFVAIGLWLIGAFGSPPVSRNHSAAVTSLAGWTCVVFFGLCGVISLKKLFDTGEQLRIGPTGVRSTPWSDQMIPWSEITDVTSWSYKRQKAMVLHLRNPKRFPGHGVAAKLASANRMLTGGDLSISLAATDRGFEEAMLAVARFRP